MFLFELATTNGSTIESEELLKSVNSLRDDVKDDLDRTKLAMQMHLIVELERLRVRSTMMCGIDKQTIEL